jgi:hypothetical protein
MSESIKVEVDIAEFSTRAMIGELQYRGIITIAEREALSGREKAPTDRSMNILSHHDAKMRVIAARLAPRRFATPRNEFLSNGVRAMEDDDKCKVSDALEREAGKSA